MMKEAIPYQPEQDAIDWRTSWRRVKHAVSRHIPLIVASVGCSLLLLFAYIKIFPPIYRGEVMVQGELNEDVVRSNYYSAWNIFRKGDLKSEPELITSAKVSKEVVQRLGLKFNDVYHSFLTQVAYLWTDSWVGKGWRKFKEWLFPPDPAAYKATPEEIDFARTVDAFRDGVTVEFVNGTAIARVVVKAPTYRAAEFANKVAEVYLKQRSKGFQEEGAEAYNSLVEEVARAKGELTELDQKKYDFDLKNKVVLDFEKDKLQVNTWNALRTSINEVKANIASLEASLQVVQQQLATEPREIVSSRTLQDSKTKGLMQGREFELRASLQQNRERYQPDSPEVRLLEKSLAEARDSLQKEPDRVEVGQQVIMNPVYAELRQKENSLRENLAAAKATLAAKSAPLAEVEKRLDQVPALVRNVVEQTRIRDGLELRYKVLRDRAMQADISRQTVATAPASVRVIDWATPPMKASWPKNIILLPSALALGLVVGLALALLAEVFSTQVNLDRLASRPDIPVYAVIDLRPEGLLALPGALAPDARSVVERLRRLN